MTPEALAWDADEGSAFAALAEVPIQAKAWRYDRELPWQAPEPHVWTPGSVTLEPGLVWVVCARTKAGGRSLRIYPLRDAEGRRIMLSPAPVLAAAAGAAVLHTSRLTRREVLFGSGLALIAALLPAAAPAPQVEPPAWRLVALTGAEGPAVAVPHAGLALVAQP